MNSVRLDGLLRSFQNSAMKECPKCGAEYEDSISFCARDGRVLLTKTNSSARLCPDCANSISEDAVTCPYCKADVSAGASPQWPTREEPAGEAKPSRRSRRRILPVTIVFVLAILLFAAGVFLTAGQTDRTESQLLLEQKIKEVQEKDQQIQALEAQLEQVRQDLSDSSNQVSDLRAKLDETQKELATSQTRVSLLNREIERLGASRAQVAAKPPTPAVEPRPASPPPAEAIPTSPPPAPQPTPRRPAQTGSYETLRPTSVHAEPSPSSPVLSQIGSRTKVMVVGSVGDWLEVRSRHGNPPGFIRRDDAMYVGGAN